MSAASEVNNFDVLKAMAAENRRICLAPLSNVLRAQKVKAGTQITIGVEGDVVAAILNGTLVGGLILADKAQFEETKRKLEEAAVAAPDAEAGS